MRFRNFRYFENPLLSSITTALLPQTFVIKMNMKELIDEALSREPWDENLAEKAWKEERGDGRWGEL